MVALLWPAARGAAQMEFSLEESETPPVETETPPEEQQQQQPTGSGDIFADIVSDEGEGQGDESADTGEHRDENVEEVFAIQRVYALRRHRMEIAGNAAITLNDPYQSRLGLGLGLNYWFTNVLAIGANAIWYDFGGTASESDTAFFTRRSTRLGIPLTEWQTGAWLNFTYVPIYGKFAAFNRFIFEWDAYIVGGVGMMRSRPIPVFDPSVREFDWGTHVAFNVGLGLRIFMSRWLTLNVEFRDYMFLEQYENTRIPVDPVQRADSDNWLSSGSTLVQNASIQVGLTFFIPPSFEYHQPK